MLDGAVILGLSSGENVTFDPALAGAFFAVKLNPSQRPSVELRVAREGFQRNKNEKRAATRRRPGIPKCADSAGRGRP